MPANYDLSDLELLLPFVPTKDGVPFPWMAQAAGEDVLYLADEKGLWMRVPDEFEEAVFEAVTGFRRRELRRERVDGIYIYALKDGGPLLPFPFTVNQLIALDEQSGRVFSERVYHYDEMGKWNAETSKWIAELAQLNPKSAELARALVYGELPPDHSAASVPMTGSASDAPESQPTHMKKLALIAALVHEWPSIDADMREASRNGLKTAAHAGTHGQWDIAKARAWAVSKGKLRQVSPMSLPVLWPGSVVRNRL